MNFCVVGLQSEHVLHMVKAKPQGASARWGHKSQLTWLSVQSFRCCTLVHILLAAANAVLVPVHLELQQLLSQAQQHLPLHLQTQGM